MKILPVNKILNSTQVTKKINNVAIPVLATPIIMAMEDIYGNYYNMSSLIISSSDSSKTRHAKEILKFMHDNDIEKPLYLKPHYDTKDGFDYNSKQKIKNALEKAYKENKITKDEYKQYRDKITFTGNKGNTDINNLSDSPSTSEIDDIDISMPDELQDIIDIPTSEFSSDILSNVTDVLPDGFDADEDILSTFKGFIESITDL